MRAEQQGHTLQTTALINEAYFKLIRQRRVRWANRSQFFGVAAILMRRILFDHAKERGRAKRGGSMQRVSLSEVSPVFKEGAGEFIELHEALNRLEELDERKALVVSLRYFGGLSIKEIAEMLHVAPSTVSKDWEFARAWLRAEMSHEE
jgi:RNA polymerase sigma factor (TIGR02999 family)